MDSIPEDKEDSSQKETVLTPAQAEIVKLSRAHDQMYHSPVQDRLKIADEIQKRMFEVAQANGIRIIDSDLIGFDEDKQDFEHGHGTEPDRRERTGRKSITNGKGAFCILVDEKKGEHLTIVDFDNPQDKAFLEEKKDILKKFVDPEGTGTWGTYKHKNVVLIQGTPVNILA